MIDQLPEGKSIGWIQAPLDWIFSHTVRFVGIVRIVIQDGEGFILIRKGKPLVYYFKHVRIELRGNTALDYFKSRPILEFNLCKYTPDEISRALKICNVREDMPETAGIPVQAPARETDAESDGMDQSSAGLFEKDPIPDSPKKPEQGKKTPGPAAEKLEPVGQIPDPVAEITSLVGKKPQPARKTPEPAAAKSEPVRQTPDPVAEITSLVRKKPEPVDETPEPVDETPEPVAEKPEPVGQIPDPVAEITSLVGKKPQLARKTPEPAAEDPKPVRQTHDTAAEVTSPVIEPSADPDTTMRGLAEPAVPEDPDTKIIGRIRKLNGIIAISVFNDDRNILLLGDVEIEPLLDSARSMLATANRIQPHLNWGSFVHMTLQIPDGNMILAPYHENHLCILTTRTINIGHIRRILRTLQQE